MVAYSFKKRFVSPIRVGLGMSLRPEDQDDAAATLLLPKRQTIRAYGKRRHARAGETLQLYHAMRTKQCFKIGEATCTEVVPVSILVGEHSMVITSGKDTVKGGLIHAFARLDGFASGEDMLAFWKEEHGLGRFEGIMIRWRP